MDKINFLTGRKKMFCPKCRSEFKEGVAKCPDCGLELVDVLPPEPKLEYVEFETVFKTANPGIITIAKSILEDAKIHYSMKSEGLQSIYALGVVEIQVSKEEASAARQLLSGLEENVV